MYKEYTSQYLAIAGCTFEGFAVLRAAVHSAFWGMDHERNLFG